MDLIDAFFQARAPGTPIWALPASQRRMFVWSSVLLFAAITVLRWFLERSGQDASLFYVIPISLVALVSGRRGGLKAAVAGIVLFSLFAAVHGKGDLDLTGWAAPMLAMLVVGVVLGDVCDRAREKAESAEILAERRQLLEELCARQQDALAASDAMVQGVAAARWLIDAGETERALETLTATVTDGIARLHRGSGGPASSPPCEGPSPSPSPTQSATPAPTPRAGED